MAQYELILPPLDMPEPIRASLWLVKRGARVVEGDRVLEVLAGCATVDLPAPVTGTLVKKLVAEDEPIRAGQCLAIFETDDAE